MCTVKTVYTIKVEPHGHAISRTNGRIFHTLTASVKDFVINNLASTDW